MDPFQPWKTLVDGLVFQVLGLDPKGTLGSALDFFLYDSVKILVLLVGVIWAVSLVRSFFPPEKVRIALAKLPKPAAHLAAAALGIVTPFCSCSAVPLFLGFVEAGVPLGVTFTFLVASPMVNEVALVLLWGLFGWQTALLYIASGVVIAVLAGWVIGNLKVENLLEDFVLKVQGRKLAQVLEMRWKDRWAFAWGAVADILGRVWIWVLVGVALGAFIHGYVPTDLLAQVAGKDSWFAVPAAVLLGIPLYSNAAGVLPLVAALTEKGVAMGTALSFMMAVTALSLPEFIILRKVMKTRLILIFGGTAAVGITAVGYLFNTFLK